MEGQISPEEGIWITAQFKASKVSLATPRTVLIQEEDHFYPFPKAEEAPCCIAICKRACLQKLTRGNPVSTGSTNISQYTNKTVAIAECRVLKGPLEESGNSNSSSPHMIHPQVNYLLFVCEEFLTNFGFFKNEVVWMRPIEPLPLERVVITPMEDADDSVEALSEAVRQLYNQCMEGYVIANTGFQLLHQAVLPPSTPSTHDSEKAEIPASDNKGEEEFLKTSPGSSSDDEGSLPPPVVYRVLETVPILQGRVTRDTAIVVVPYDLSNGTREEVGGALSPLSAEGDDLFGEASSMSQALYPSLPRNRTVSASEIQLEEGAHHLDMSPFVDDVQPTSLPVIPSISVTESVSSYSLVIEARLAEEFTLLHHYVLLPKNLARQHNIWDLQNVLITAKQVGPVTRGRDSLQNAVLTINNELKPLDGKDAEGPQPSTFTRRHLAIVRVYESENGLEEWAPRVELGYQYNKRDLCVAYLHPELMFTLFPETLSAEPRKYLIEIENIMATPSPSPVDSAREISHPLATTPAKHLTATKQIKMDIKRMFLGHVATPTSAFSNELVRELIQKHLIEPKNDRILMSKGDVFSLTTEHGQLLLRVVCIQPHFDNGGISGEEYSYTGQSVSYLPHLFTPSSPGSYWECLHPPGLEEYTHTLFQYFLPYLMPKKVHPSSACCTSVLMSGPPGVGKITIIRAAARRCRLNMIEFNCYEFCNEGLRLAEQKLSNAFDKAVKLAPCVMVLREIHVLTKQDLSLSSGSNEPRIDTAFEAMVSSINEQIKESNFPLIVVGVTSYPKEVSPRIQHSFLHELKINPPTQEQRVRIVKGLSLQYPISRDIDVADIARRSAGFVLGDYIELFSKARKIALMGVSSLMSSNSTGVGWLKAHNMSIFGMLITQTHLDSALSVLHSSHSGYIGAPKIPNVKWKDVGGLEEAKKEILETIQLPLLHPELFVGGLRRSGILLYGAPGTGKTLLAKAVATECSLNFLSVKGPELINMYVGQTEENIREIFSRARGAAPCVVFFDELDSLAPNRGKSGDSGGVMDRVVSQLLAELDGLDQKKDVFMIGATNRPDLIDPALLRPGRFDRLVYLDVCDDVQSKLTILKAITRKFNLDEDVDLNDIAEKCPPNLTGADLYALCADAMLASLREQISELESKGLSDADWNGSLLVTHQQFLSCLSALKPSVSEEELEMYRKKQFLQGNNDNT